MELSHNPTTLFPWRTNNRFQLLSDSHAYYPAMLESIDSARKFILLEMYLIQPGEVFQQFQLALIAAVRRGVKVYLLLDDFGARTLLPAQRHALTAAGLRLCFFNPLKVFKFHLNLIRDHRKLLLVDDIVAYVGGAGLADSFAGDMAWREQMLRLEGECVSDWRRLFTDTWNLWSKHKLKLVSRVQARPATPVCKGRVLAGHYFSARELKRTVIQHIRHAQRRVWITSAYFLPPLKLHSVIRRAARNGVDVRILVPGPETDHPAIRIASQKFYTRMLHCGVRIFEYQPRFMHAKGLICDDLVSIGSCNFDRWSLRWNLEANQEIMDPGFAEQVTQVFLADLEHSAEITLPQWLQRSPWLRFRESLLGLIEAWVARRSYRLQLKLEARKRLEKLHL